MPTKKAKPKKVATHKTASRKSVRETQKPDMPSAVIAAATASVQLPDEAIQALQAAFADAGIVAKGATPNFEALKGKVAIVRCGKAIDESTTLAEKNSDVVFIDIDSETELAQRGKVHDGWRSFAIEYYFPRTGAAVYGDLEMILLADPRFRDLFAEIKEGVFKHVKAEADNWENLADPADSLKAQPLENLGGGGAVYLGALRIGAAVRGRDYQPNRLLPSGVPNPDYDMRDDLTENPHLPKRTENVRTVSLLSDLLAALKRERVKIVVIAGGFDGATGSSCLIVLGKLLMPVKSFSTVPLCMCTLPEYFLVKGKVPAPHADRLNAMNHLLGRCGVLAGMGQGGIVWKAVADHAGTWGGLYVNVYNLSKTLQCAPVLTVAAMPLRDDLETRFLLGLMALSDMPLDQARETILRYASDTERNRVRLKAKPYRSDVGVEITVVNSDRLLIHQWQELMPALTVFHRHLGEDNVTLPVTYDKTVVKEHWLFGKHTEKVRVTEEKPIQSVVIINALLDGLGAKQVADLRRRPEAWAVLIPEARMIEGHQMKTFADGFAAMDRDFSTFMTEILLKGLFDQYVYNPTVYVYDDEDLPKTVLAWGVINAGTDAYADKVLGELFAKVDRSVEEAAALAALEREREAKVQQQTAQAMAEIFAQVTGRRSATPTEGGV
ncbi:MAG: hypothetical protein UY91_C0042G0001 [Parcubacteria group bacterium GW2011_GWB1_55_9]|nr:MAG: hypothetical protein UY91_C0042G0001 [Parcubacteria group bacterium GW2011_GWB1_55_9]